ncbi:MAG: GDP-mannose 4,6-dehydratase [Bryobacteraceae bacterium]|jgi:UDP-glucuronate 4-epimerase
MSQPSSALPPRILLTGGAGFIGSHLAEALLRRGVELLILDDLNDYYDPALKLANLEQVRRAGAYEFVQGDICDAALVESLMARFRPAMVAHLAARAGVRPSLEQPALYQRVNVEGTAVLLEAARRHGVERFVFASSSSVYGAASRVPFTEEDPVRAPISPYAASKIAGEALCHVYWHLYGIRTVCLRFFTVYGPRQRPDLAIRKFAEAIAAGRPVPVFGDGTTGRDYTYIDDIVAGILAAMEHPAAFEIFNLGNSSPVLLNDMIATLERVLGRKAVIDRQPLQPGDVPITYADISRARRLLGWQPRTPLEEGIRRMAEWLGLASA